MMKQEKRELPCGVRNIAIYFTNTFFKGFLLFVWIAGLPIWKKEARSTKAVAHLLRQVI